MCALYINIETLKHVKRMLIGPVSQVITLRGLPDKGAIRDEGLEIVREAGIVVEDGVITRIGPFAQLKNADALVEIHEPSVVLPGFVDAHTHLCFSGTRAQDYSLRISGDSYAEILRRGGGIYDTVEKTRHCSQEELLSLTLRRLDRHLTGGVTTCEIKSGYGLSVESELKMLNVIREAGARHPSTVVPTCLAAHVPAMEFDEPLQYLQYLVASLLPLVKRESLSNRVDIFVEPSAFTPHDAEMYLRQARYLGFEVVVHADQFTSGGSMLAVKMNALSADHLESSGDASIAALSNSNTTATVLPGASLGLGMKYAPARKLLDSGCSVAIASDWNPGSAPMGDLLTQAALISAFEKLSNAETFAGITFRAARALELTDRGILSPGMRADFVAFPVSDYREILYHQGKLRPHRVWVAGEEIVNL